MNIIEHFVNGKNILGDSKRTSKVFNPATGEQSAEVKLASTKDMDKAIEAAKNAVVEAVNFNSPGQVVIAGDIEAVKRATVLAKDKGAKRAMLLPVSVPSHCALMKPAAEQLEITLTTMTIYKPVIPVIHNANVGQGDDDKAIKHLLAQQLHTPVRWVETIQRFSSLGVTNIIEC